MKLMIKCETLLKPLQLLSGIVERKQTLPILSNVLLKIKGNNISITGADLEIELIASVVLEHPIDKEISLTVSAGKLMDICRVLPKESELTITYRDSRLIIESGESHFSLTTLPAKDFPSLDETSYIIKNRIPKEKVLRLLKLTAFAMAQQDVRYYLNGMLWQFDKKLFRTVATDGHRMAVASTTHIEETISEPLQVIVPRKAVLELLRLLENINGEVDIEVSHYSVRVTASDYIFTTKLVDGRFPDYQKVIPHKGDKEIVFDKNDLKQSLTRSSILCNEKLRAVTFQFRKGMLSLLSNNIEQEQAEIKISIDYQGEDFDIIFNVNYLLDLLNVYSSEKIKFILKDSGSSGLVEEVDGRDEALFVIMPMCL